MINENLSKREKSWKIPNQLVDLVVKALSDLSAKDVEAALSGKIPACDNATHVTERDNKPFNDQKILRTAVQWSADAWNAIYSAFSARSVPKYGATDSPCKSFLIRTTILALSPNEGQAIFQRAIAFLKETSCYLFAKISQQEDCGTVSDPIRNGQGEPLYGILAGGWIYRRSRFLMARSSNKSELYRKTKIGLDVLFHKLVTPTAPEEMVRQTLKKHKAGLTSLHPTSPEQNELKSEVISNINSIIKCVFDGETFDFRDIVPSTNASFSSSRELGGAFGEMIRGFLKQHKGQQAQPSLLQGDDGTGSCDDHQSSFITRLSCFDRNETLLAQFQKQVDKRVIEQIYSPDPSVNAEPLGILEPYKVRVVTKGDAAFYYRSMELQKFLWSTVKKHRAFKFIGEPISDEEFSKIFSTPCLDFETFVSGDYQSATDNLDPKLSTFIWISICQHVRCDPAPEVFFGPDEISSIRQLLKDISVFIKPGDEHIISDLGPLFDEYESGERERSRVEPLIGPVGPRVVRPSKIPLILTKWCLIGYLSLVRHRLFYRLDTGDYEGFEQRWGQLMGSPVSFPILCLANFITAFTVIKRRHAQLTPFIFLNLYDIIVNGDDIAFRIERELYPTWIKFVGAVGFAISRGKNYESQNFIIVNSEYRRPIKDCKTILEAKLDRSVLLKMQIPLIRSILLDELNVAESNQSRKTIRYFLSAVYGAGGLGQRHKLPPLESSQRHELATKFWEGCLMEKTALKELIVKLDHLEMDDAILSLHLEILKTFCGNHRIRTWVRQMQREITMRDHSYQDIQTWGGSNTVVDFASILYRERLKLWRVQRGLNHSKTQEDIFEQCSLEGEVFVPSLPECWSDFLHPCSDADPEVFWSLPGSRFMWKKVPYVNLSILWNYVKKGPEAGTFRLSTRRAKWWEMGDLHRALIEGFGRRVKSLLTERFLVRWEEEIKNIPPGVSLFLPKSCGGVGLVPVDDRCIRSIHQGNLSWAGAFRCLDPEKRFRFWATPSFGPSNIIARKMRDVGSFLEETFGGAVATEVNRGTPSWAEVSKGTVPGGLILEETLRWAVSHPRSYRFKSVRSSLEQASDFCLLEGSSLGRKKDFVSWFCKWAPPGLVSRLQSKGVQINLCSLTEYEFQERAMKFNQKVSKSVFEHRMEPMSLDKALSCEEDCSFEPPWRAVKLPVQRSLLRS